MKIEFYNCPKEESFNQDFLSAEKPTFLDYVPDFALIEKIAGKYSHYKNMLLIGHGGSFNPFYGFYHALKMHRKKEVYFLNTIDPDYITELKNFLVPENTLVITVSKSGENTTQLEMLTQFLEFRIIALTGKGSPLYQAAQGADWDIVEHPPIGGRYAGLTEDGLLPAALCGLDFKEMWQGGKECYTDYEKNNPAWQTASVFKKLEDEGYADVLMLFYSHYLFPSSTSFVQLCHESFGKDGKGMSFFAHEGPEVQHHTTQRVYGGKKNIGLIFFSLENFENNISSFFPPKISQTDIKQKTLESINHIPLAKAIEYELNANIEDSKRQGIPFVHISLPGLNAFEIGKLHGFWQMFSVYSSLLRQVNPFDQPEVEASKVLSFQSRLGYNSKNSTLLQ